MMVAKYLTDLDHIVGYVKIGNDGLLDIFEDILPIEIQNALEVIPNSARICRDNSNLRKLIFVDLGLEIICPIPFREIDFFTIIEQHQIKTQGETINHTQLNYALL